MAQTQQQYAVFNTPVNSDTYIPHADGWLFADPVKTFEIGTPLETVKKQYNMMRSTGARLVGPGRIPAKLILKVRHVHYTDFVKVVGADTVKELEKETV